MDNLQTQSIKAAEKSDTIVEITDTELTNIARKVEIVTGNQILSVELREFALSIAEVCANIVDHYENENGTAGDEIRALFKIDQLTHVNKEDMPAG